MGSSEAQALTWLDDDERQRRAEAVRKLIAEIDGLSEQRMTAFLQAHGHAATFDDFLVFERACRQKAVNELLQADPLCELTAPVPGWEWNGRAEPARWIFGELRRRQQVLSVLAALNQAESLRERWQEGVQKSSQMQKSLREGWQEGVQKSLQMEAAKTAEVLRAMRVQGQAAEHARKLSEQWQPMPVGRLWPAGKPPWEGLYPGIESIRNLVPEIESLRKLVDVPKALDGINAQLGLSAGTRQAMEALARSPAAVLAKSVGGAPVAALLGASGIDIGRLRHAIEGPPIKVARPPEDAERRVLAVRQVAADVRATSIRDESPGISLRRTALQAQAKLQARAERSLDPILALRQRGVIDDGEYERLTEGFLVELLAELPASDNSDAIRGYDAAHDDSRESELSLDDQTVQRGKHRRRQQTEAAREKRARSKQGYLDRIADDKRKGVNIMARDYCSELGAELGKTPAYIRELRSEFLKGCGPS